LAQNLELHMKALDLQDKNSRAEHEVYSRFANEHRQIASQLKATSRHMAECRDLPMGRHDDAATADPRLLQVFEEFVNAERELLLLLQKSVARDEKMLGEWRAGS
jgi:hypothetical protein